MSFLDSVRCDGTIPSSRKVGEEVNEIERRQPFWLGGFPVEDRQFTVRSKKNAPRRKIALFTRDWQRAEPLHECLGGPDQLRFCNSGQRTVNEGADRAKKFR